MHSAEDGVPNTARQAALGGSRGAFVAITEHANRDQDRIDITALRMAHGLEDQ
jgi:hypothetical protein